MVRVNISIDVGDGVTTTNGSGAGGDGFSGEHQMRKPLEKPRFYQGDESGPGGGPGGGILNNHQPGHYGTASWEPGDVIVPRPPVDDRGRPVRYPYGYTFSAGSNGASAAGGGAKYGTATEGK